MRRVTDGEREKGGGIVMIFAVRVDNLCSIKADGIMAGAVVWSEDGRFCLGGAQARWIQGLPQLDLSPAKRKLTLRSQRAGTTLRPVNPSMRVTDITSR